MVIVNARLLAGMFSYKCVGEGRYAGSEKQRGPHYKGAAFAAGYHGSARDGNAASDSQLLKMFRNA
jgi:hypothetical protein